MSGDYWNYTDCIRSDNLELIEQALTRIFEQSGCRRISRPPQPLPDEELERDPWDTARDLWIVGLFGGAPGWTIVKTWPDDLLCRRANGATRPRLSELAMQVGRDAFHLGVYNTYFSILLEADAQGRTFISGDVDCDESEKGKFYDEQINELYELQFFLIDVSESMKAVMREPRSPEEKEKKDRRGEKTEEFLALSETEQESFVWDETVDDWWELSKSDAQVRYEALGELLGGPGPRSYWELKKLVYKAYVRQQQLEADGARLLYFQPDEYYRKLDTTELFSKY